MADESTNRGRKTPRDTLALHVQLIASERAAIWQRYAALLVANSLIATILPHAGDAVSAGVILVFAVVLCIVWFSITSRGWTLFNDQLVAARKAEMRELPPALDGGKHPIELVFERLDATPATPQEKWRDSIRRHASTVIIVVALLQLAMGARMLYSLIDAKKIWPTSAKDVGLKTVGSPQPRDRLATMSSPVLPPKEPVVPPIRNRHSDAEEEAEHEETNEHGESKPCWAGRLAKQRPW